MSKRTYVYAGYGSASNDTTLSFRPTGLAVGPVGGGDAKGFQLGLSHSF
jgi:predicted porin